MIYKMTWAAQRTTMTECNKYRIQIERSRYIYPKPEKYKGINLSLLAIYT